LVVINGGREQMRKQIVVNDPLTYQGIRFYQANFGRSNKVDRLSLQVSSSGVGDVKTVTLATKQAVPLNAERTITLQRFIPDYYVQDGEVYQRSEALENPAIQLALVGKGQSHSVWLFPRERRTAEDAQSGYSFMLTDLKLANFTGLEVSHEPGQWFVWGGVILMAFGLGVAFYLVHMRFWVTTVFDGRQGLLLWVGGACNKNRERFEQRFAEVSRAIGEEIELSGQKPQSGKLNEPAQQETLARA
jgi:cytochrome c biogenesis protein